LSETQTEAQLSVLRASVFQIPNLQPLFVRTTASRRIRDKVHHQKTRIPLKTKDQVEEQTRLLSVHRQSPQDKTPIGQRCEAFLGWKPGRFVRSSAFRR